MEEEEEEMVEEGDVGPDRKRELREGKMEKGKKGELDKRYKREEN